MKKTLLLALCLMFAFFANGKGSGENLPLPQDLPPLPEELKPFVTETPSKENYFPMLKPGSWSGVSYGAVYSTLIETDNKPELVISYGYDTPGHYFSLMEDDADPKTLETIIANAYKNLDALEIEFIPVDFLDGKALIVSSHSFGSEVMLSKQQMLKAHRQLDAERLFVSVPKRTLMMVTSQDAPDEIINKFLSIHDASWRDDDITHAPISNRIFIVENGDLVGSIPWGG